MLDGIAVLVEYGYVHIVKGDADGSQATYLLFNFLFAAHKEVVFGGQHSDGGGGFGLAEGVDEIDAGEFGDGAADDFHGHRGGAVGDDLEAGEVAVAEFGVIHKHFEHSGHHHGAAGALGFHKAHPVVGLELALDDEGSSAEYRRHNRLHSGDVV